MAKSIRTCSIDGCPREHYAREWCALHYERWRTTGDPGSAQPSKRYGTTAERFWPRVDKTADCWIWTGSIDDKGYGRVGVGSTSRAAHRVAYELTHGSIPKGLVLDHICHNPPCVNPDHLRPVTYKQNMENRANRSNRNSKTGVRGVWESKTPGLYVAAVTHHGQRHYLGLFPTVDEAGEAVRAKRMELFSHNDLDRL